MTLVFNTETKGPGTHALIVASGDVPRQPDASASGPLIAAAGLASWLIERFRNPGAGLASIDILASAPGGTAFYHTPPGGAGSVTLEPPQFESLKYALEAWRERLNSDPGNIAFFYYAGYVFRRPETLLALQDFAGAAVSFPSLLGAMMGCRADRHLYIVDGLPLHVGTAAQAMRPRSFNASAPRNAEGWAVIYGETTSWPEAETPFSNGLLQVLGPPRGRKPISVQDIVDRLPAKLKGSGARMVTTQIDGNFELHHPGLQVRSRGSLSAGEPAATGRGRARPADGTDKPEATDGAEPYTAPSAEAESDFIPDDAEAERDSLGRAGLAIVLARRLHQVWRRSNQHPAPDVESRAAFVIHIDAPWGGGKTSFANFLGRVLNPCPVGGGTAAFLRERYPGDVGGIFLADPPHDKAGAARLAALPADVRRPWIVIGFNAWQAEHVAPPWWVFYQAIRKGCFDAIRREGDGAWRPRRPDAPRWRGWLDRARRGLRARVGGKLAWLSLMIGEYAWRLLNPKIYSLIATAALGLLMLLLLQRYGVWGRTGQDQGGFLLTSGAGLFAAGLTGIAALWALGALVTESIMPGTSSLAERLSLGIGDPFERFRTHFARTMEGLRRPVMVIVDDLDRCRPDFVVDLVRGIQTLLRSPRVVFVILGDRDWIERAFESHHDKMKLVDVGPEQTFGARFVEKAIQMSFILPALAPDRQQAYVRQVLLGERAAPAGPPDVGSAPARAREAKDAAAVNKVMDDLVDRQRGNPLVTPALVEFAVSSLASVVPGAAPLALASATVGAFLRERLASRIATDRKVEEDVRHRLEPLAPYFPANPRQIKRIVNAITLYYAAAVALQRPGLVPNETFRAQLALWVIIMTEWPKSWRLLASFPELVDLLGEPDPKKAARRPGLALPGSVAATLAALAPILADRSLMSLITGKDSAGKASHNSLQTAAVRTLAELIPLHNSMNRLADPAEAKSAARPKAAAAKPAVKPKAAAVKRAPRRKAGTAKSATGGAAK